MHHTRTISAHRSPSLKSAGAGDRALLSTARSLIEEAACARVGSGLVGRPTAHDIQPRLEARLVAACWTLRRLPDREAGFLRLRGSLWPETAPDSGSYADSGLTTIAARRQARPSALEIDQMQPTLDFLLLLPDIDDRRHLFWACWHQDGEWGGRIPWAKVRRSLGQAHGGASRWTLKRRYGNALNWLSRLIEIQHFPG